MIHIGGQNKVIFAFHQSQQIVIHRLRRAFIAVHHNVTAPPGPILLQRLKGIEAPGVHIPNTVLLLEIPEVFLKPLPGIRQPRRGGKSRSRSDHYGVRGCKQLFQPLNFLQAVPGGSARQYP